MHGSRLEAETNRSSLGTPAECQPYAKCQRKRSGCQHTMPVTCMLLFHGNGRVREQRAVFVPAAQRSRAARVSDKRGVAWRSPLRCCPVQQSPRVCSVSGTTFLTDLFFLSDRYCDMLQITFCSFCLIGTVICYRSLFVLSV